MIYKGEKSIEYLFKSLDLSDVGESSHWKKYNKNFDYDGKIFSGLEGFGGNTRYSLLRQCLSDFFQKKFYNSSKNFKFYLDKAKAIAKNQNRLFDLDFLRQAITLSFLDEKIGKCSSTLVIGDGFASMTSLLIDSDFSSKVVLVNLNKQLMVDLYFLKQYMGISKFNSEVALITNEDDAKSILSKINQFSVMAIQAENHKLVKYFDIDLVLNIVSMGEMLPSSVSEYFNDIRNLSNDNKNLYFYCCNRLEKQMPDGSYTKFLEYPWKKDDKIIVDELCPWHKEYISLKPPFFRKFDGPILHQLRVMSK